MKSKFLLFTCLTGYLILTWVLYTDPAVNGYAGAVYGAVGIAFLCFYLMVTNTHPRFMDRFDHFVSLLKRQIPEKPVLYFNRVRYILSMISPYALAMYLGWQAHSFYILPAASFTEKFIMMDDNFFLALLLVILVLSPPNVRKKEG